MPGKTSLVLWAALPIAIVLAAGTWWLLPAHGPEVPTIALIPQSAGTMLGEVEHLGATAAAEKLRYRLYWNAPTSVSDLSGQVSLIDRVVRGSYQGLVVAPNHPLATLTPIRRALAAGLPVVIVSGMLDLPPMRNLAQLVNDEEKMGDVAAEEAARLLHGKGAIAMIGLGRNAPGAMLRAHRAEAYIANHYPQIAIVARAGGAYNAPRAEDLIGSAIDAHPDLGGVLTFTAEATRGAYAALKSRSLVGRILLVGCEQDSDLIAAVGKGEIAAVVAEDAYRMGYEAVEMISGALAGKAMPQRTLVPPLLITQANVESPEAKLVTNASAASGVSP